MRRPYLQLALVSVLVAVVASKVSQPAALLGCAPAPMEKSWVEIEDEAAFIVWDAANQVEHFVRYANFTTDSADFGFLVPTPSEPELGEVDSRLFKSLQKLTAPEIKYVDRHVPDAPPQSRWDGKVMSAPNAPLPSVEVLQQTHVAGFDAAVLKANDPQALEDWLVEHHYAFRPALRDWVQEYIDNAWIITAFKLSSTMPPPGARFGFSLQSVRMSFKTERPFYPYREPADMRDPALLQGKGRTLRVFVLGTEKMEGRLESAGQTEPGEPWQAKTVWSKMPPANSVQQTLNYLQPVHKPGEESPSLKFAIESVPNAWLTEFEDDAFPRPGTKEVFFAADKDQSPVVRPPIIRERIIYDGVAMPVVGEVFVHDTYVEVHPSPIGIALVAVAAVVIVGLVIGFIWWQGKRRQERAE